MRKLATLFLAVAVYALMGDGVAAADGDNSRKRQQERESRQQTPESIVICGGQGVIRRQLPNDLPPIGAALGVEAITTPESITLERCNRAAPCAPCIRSLENQGCKVLDLIVNAGGGGSGDKLPSGVVGDGLMYRPPPPPTVAPSPEAVLS